MSSITKKKAWFKIFDHTADIGVNTFGPTVTDVFEQAARGMFDIIFHSSMPKIQSKGEFEIKLQATDLEQLLVDWLSELLYIYSTQQIAICEYKIEIDMDSSSLDAHVYGETVAEDILLRSTEVKAVTYHMLSVTETSEHDGWEATVLFDI